MIANSRSGYLVQLDLETRCEIARNSYHRTDVASKLVFEGRVAPAIHHTRILEGIGVATLKQGAADGERVVSPR